MRKLAVLATVLLGLAVLSACPSHAQTAGAPVLSFQRVSIGIGADFTAYRPTVLGDVREEFRAVLPVSYNLGQYSSLTARYTRGLESRRNEYSVGVVFHLLARGKRL